MLLNAAARGCLPDAHRARLAGPQQRLPILPMLGDGFHTAREHRGSSLGRPVPIPRTRLARPGLPTDGVVAWWVHDQASPSCAGQPARACGSGWRCRQCRWCQPDTGDQPAGGAALTLASPPPPPIVLKQPAAAGGATELVLRQALQSATWPGDLVRWGHTSRRRPKSDRLLAASEAERISSVTEQRARRCPI